MVVVAVCRAGTLRHLRVLVPSPREDCYTSEYLRTRVTLAPETRAAVPAAAGAPGMTLQAKCMHKWVIAYSMYGSQRKYVCRGSSAVVARRVSSSFAACMCMRTRQIKHACRSMQHSTQR